MRGAQYNRGADSAFLTLEGCKARYQLGRSSIEKIAQEAGAALKIGRCKRYDRDRMDAYIRGQAVE